MPVNALTTDYAHPVKLMQVYIDGVKRYEVAAASLNTSLSLTTGYHRLTVQAMDSASTWFKKTIYVTAQTTAVAPAASPMTTSYQNDLTATSQWLAAHSTLPDGAILYGSSQINPYYSNLAAIGWTKDPTRYGAVKAWMQWYLNHLNWPDKWGLYGTVYDYNVSGSVETSTGNADSTDSYAATFLSLAWAYYRTGDPNAQAYIKTLGYQLDVIGGILVLTQQSDGLTWAKPDYQIKYLMDNCEAYRGLLDLALIFQYAFNDSTKAAYYNARASMMYQGIQSMWLGSSFAVYKDALGRQPAPNWGTWYPDATAQLFPVLMGVIPASSSKASTIYSNFNNAWPGWPNLSFNSQDPFPWMLVADTAAVMGDSTRVNTYTRNIQSKYVNTGFPWPWYSAEAGWFMRLDSYMLGRGPL